MALTPGTRFGTYEVIAPLGAGGMGEVYRARDARLHREVALKVLPETMSFDTDRLARLEREAQVLASLSHPNIAAIYGLENGPAEAGPHDATLDVGAAFRRPILVLELVEGPTLAERIAAGALPLDEAMPIARQIASALEAAHDAGIIHRDLKPANIKIRPDGAVKVLDFGLAKAVEGRSGHSGTASMSPTLTTPAMTGIGAILGTAAYMAPEQARGRTLDKRADIWAFGCVLFEMLAGRRAFEGSDVTDVLASVIKSDPDWSALPADVPATVRTTLRRCLQKDPAQRFRDIGDVRLALDGAFQTEIVAGPVLAAPSLARRAGIPVLAALLLSAATGAAVWMLTRPAAGPVIKLTITHPGPEVVGGALSDVAITPDGRRVVYLASTGGGSRLFVRALDQLRPVALAADRTNLALVFLSPDGEWVGFGDGSDRIFKRVPITGGPPLAVTQLGANISPSGAVWLPNGAIIFGQTTGPLMRVAEGGGSPEPLTTIDPKREVAHMQPHMLPGGKALLFTVRTTQSTEPSVAVLDLDTRQHRIIAPSGSSPAYVPTGHLVYAAGGTLRAVPFDLSTLTPSGTPAAVVDAIAVDTDGSASFAISPTGTLAYISGTSAPLTRMLVWVDRQGREEPLAVPARAYAYARLSPDGARIALDVRDETNDIWTWDVERKALTRVTFDPGLNRGPVWTPDSRRIAFTAPLEGSEAMFWQPADGSGSAEALTTDATIRVPNAFSTDGRWLLFNQPGTAPYDTGVIDLQGDRQPRLILNQQYSESNAVLSPDGRWMAYQSDESGRSEIYVRPFPDVNSARFQVSTNGGTRPLWSRDGRELFYYLPPGVIVAAPVQIGATFKAGAPRELFKGTYLSPQTGRMYDVSPDGKRFLMIKEARREGEAPPPPQLVVVQNWTEELKRLAPIR